MAYYLADTEEDDWKRGALHIIRKLLSERRLRKLYAIF